MRTPNYWPFAADLYARALFFARGYARLQQEATDLLEQSPAMDGQPRGTQTSDPTFAAAVRRARVRREIFVLDTALNCIEPEYREIVKQNLYYGVPLNDLDAFSYASQATWTRKRRAVLVDIVLRNQWAEVSE